jgi:hypothetical protein
MKLVACTIAMLTGAALAQPAPEEGWNGLGTHVEAVCGIDDTIGRFERQVSELLDGTKLPVATSTARTKACTACIAADRAIRTFAPLVADVQHHPALAAKLRALPAITTRKQARDAENRVEALIDGPDGGLDDDSGNGYHEALALAFDAIARAADPPETPDAKGCFAYEGGAENESLPGQVLLHALELGVPESVVRGQAIRLVGDLVSAARSR